MRIENLLNGSCDETREHLSDHLEGELRGWKRIRVIRHLARCERCREVLASLRQAVEQLRKLGQTEPLELSVVEAVVSKIGDENGSASALTD